MQKTATKIKK